MFAIGGGVGREITIIANAVAQFRSFLRAELFFSTGLDAASAVAIIAYVYLYLYRNTTCRPAEQRHLQPTRPRK